MRQRGSTVRSGPYGRRLTFEELERRDLLAVIRLVDWNTLNGPNDATDDAHFETILEAIGNETVQGNTKRLDILALQETDAPPDGDSIGRIESILESLYPAIDYASAASSRDGGGDYTGFVYDTSTVSLLEAVEIAPESLTHKILRGEFRPVGTQGETDFFVYTIHLKSGDSLAEEAERAAEAAILRADADALGEGTTVLFVGDFNMKDSGEATWSTLLASGNAQLHDLADAPGDWVDNEDFKHLHTQDPRYHPMDPMPMPMTPGSGMDDRFDILFGSGEVFDGVGLEYVDGSYRVFGNNGTHTLNRSIATGTGASPTVLDALAQASDHLPVIADFETVFATPNVRVVESGGSTQVVEGSQDDTYYIVLDTVPAADVTVTVSPDAEVDVGSGLGMPVELLFTPGNALTPQVITVSAVDDMLPAGNRNGFISHSSVSTDPDYDMLSIAGVSVLIIDNFEPEVQPIVITEIMYNPASDEQLPGLAEWIEIVNIGTTAVDLGGWYFQDQGATWGDIPGGTMLDPGQVAVFFDEALVMDAMVPQEDVFRAEWSIPDSALVIGVDWGSLTNEPPTLEHLELRDHADELIDNVSYDNTSPWPSIGSSGGPSIYLKHTSLDNNVATNWARSTLDVRNALSPTGPLYSASDVGTPGWLPLAGDYNSDFVVDAGDYVTWRNTLGSITDPRADGSGPTPGVPDGVVDALDYAWWKSHYGDELILGGSGSGGLAATLVPQTTPAATYVATVPLDVDALGIPTFTTSSASLTSSAPVVTRTLLVSGDGTASLLLTMEFFAVESTDAEEPLDTLADSASDESPAVDEFFALLSESDFVAAVA